MLTTQPVASSRGLLFLRSRTELASLVSAVLLPLSILANASKLALRVFFQSPHPSMPNLMVEDEDAVRGERPIGRAKLCSP